MPVVLFILAVVWAIYLASWARSRSDRRGVHSISTFSKHLSVLERTSPARTGMWAPVSPAPAGRPAPLYPAVGYLPPRPAMSLGEARRRRRTVLLSLSGAAVITLLFVPFLGSFAAMLHLATDALLGGYIVLLMRSQRRAAERREKVVYLPHRGHAAEPQLLFQQSVR